MEQQNINPAQNKIGPCDNTTSLGYHPLQLFYGYYIDKVPHNVLNELKVDIDSIINNNFKGCTKANEYLVGEIEHEYKLKAGKELNEYIYRVSNELEKHSGYINHRGWSNNKFESELWINFMRKYEYNPLHDHSGAYSFVIWYKVPYTYEQENNSRYKSSHNPLSHGSFNFIIPTQTAFNQTVTSIQLDVDKNKEGYCAIFPSSLGHCVYPFYSTDEYRITVAGNIKFIDKNE
jgi:hypothetical protein